MIGPRNRLAWRWLMLVLFAAAALAGVVASVAQGAAVIPPGQVLSILWNPTAQTADQIVWNLRLPRALTGAMVGSNLAVAGAILQAVMRNPLADPHIIGISAGAGITGIAVLVLFPAMTYLMTPVAFLGAMAFCILLRTFPGQSMCLYWDNFLQKSVLREAPPPFMRFEYTKLQNFLLARISGKFLRSCI